MILDVTLLIMLLIAALWTVMTIRLIRSVVGLALTSAILSAIMFRLASPLAAVFELSVCSGLISVIFITTVSFTQRISKERLSVRRKERLTKFFYLPFIVIATGILMLLYFKMPHIDLPAQSQGPDVKGLLWNMRHLDLLGQVIILLTGVFGVVILFKEPRE
jgi:NADH-quinone oxidoreductase subunit J